ncbi:MAG: hypothetical protein ACYCV7_17960, partial [Acidimicrobiales bacterium]
LLVRAGAVIPLGPTGQNTDAIGDGRWTVHCYPGTPGNTYGSDPSHTVVNVAEGRCTFRPVTASGGDRPSWEDLAAVVVDEPVSRATGAICHQPGGHTKVIDVIR